MSHFNQEEIYKNHANITAFSVWLVFSFCNEKPPLNTKARRMNDHLDLTVYERSLIDNGVRIAMKENDKSSMGSTDELIKKYHQDSNLGLFELRSKIKTHDLGKYENLSLNDLKLITNCLTLWDDFTYKKSLEETEKHKVEYYKNCELQMSALRGSFLKTV